MTVITKAKEKRDQRHRMMAPSITKGGVMLKGKQARFVEEYLVDLNATQAAIRAGYSEKTAKVIGSQNLTKLNIAAAIKSAQGKRSERLGVTVDSISLEYEEARGVAKETKQPAAMVAATTGKARVHGLLSDRPESGGQAAINIQINFVT